MDSELIFKALADPSRRQLLDLLYNRDGQSLSELEAELPMSRFGVMKHLRLLEEAGLITTEKIGREKHHYLNPIPIQFVYDRWVSKFARPFTSQLTELKYRLEHEMSETRSHRYQIYIQAAPEQIWQALTDGDISPNYYFGTRVESSFEPGAPYSCKFADGSVLIKGEIIASEPPHRLVQTFLPQWEEAARALPASRVTWLIEAAGPGSKVTLLHEELPNDPYVEGFADGWSRILSSLKTYMETGAVLKISD
ncbi:MAG: SRPBCC domain-containing protein [Anaerolineales bacterium]|nr:SRPBCC domain-containing protein [Anaerolineales bacterium]MCB0016766.1 SRPBCC domain-containing protein [Anaerolineales bacterium]MCB0027212.1 SRPBCC domain-containing protein [Anaerolineales bacterium]MCB8962823.1 SRPBCC domain-containing protein [Ardenticatenales bacterium]